MTAATEHIYHVCPRALAAAALAAGELRAPSLATEGFIHMSQRHQVPGVVQRYYAGQTDLVLLVVDPGLVHAPIRHEPPGALHRVPGSAAPDPSELFPHVYGPLNSSAIVDVLDLDAPGR